jgi:tyrosyl-tRNA synthetase
VNEAKKVLATEVTALVHGRAAADEAARIAKETFELGGSAAGLPTVLVSEAELGAGIRVAELMVRAGFADSNGAAKRLIKGGGVRVNDAKVEDEAATLDAGALAGGEAKLSVGKKNHALVRRG